MRVLKGLCCAAAIVGCLAPGARADEWNKKTYLTFSGPVQIPGATLPAGTYQFTLADPDNARHVVMVASKDGTKVYGLFLTMPNERVHIPDQNVVMFGESPAGAPQAIEAWWYPGDRSGEEFVYPRTQAMQIAKANQRTVLATDTEANTNGSESERMSALRGSKVARVDEHGNASSASAATISAESVKQAPKPTTTTASVANIRVGKTAEPTTAPRSTAHNAVGTSGAQSRRSTLPRTASNLSTLELLSGFFLAASVATRLARKRSAAAR